MKTKFGNATIVDDRYYQITSGSQGNLLKYLHILIWEDYYGKKRPDGYVIHHINGNKTDNRIQNLQCVKSTIHLKFHNTGEKAHLYGISPEKHPMYGRTGEKNPFYGKKHSEKSLELMRKAKKGKKLSEECKEKISKSLRGVKHPLFNHDIDIGKIYELYDKGMSINAIANKLGHDNRTIKRRIVMRKNNESDRMCSKGIATAKEIVEEGI